MSAYGNHNLMEVGESAFFSFSSTSENLELPVGTKAIECRASADCWVKIGEPGEDTAAVAPPGEKVWVKRTFAVRADEEKTIFVPRGSAASPIKIAVIRATVDGTLDITTRY